MNERANFEVGVATRYQISFFFFFKKNTDYNNLKDLVGGICYIKLAGCYHEQRFKLELAFWIAVL